MSIRTFRIIAIAEGISFLTLLLIAMPLKYFAGIPEAVKYTGWIHGALFMLYIPAVFLVYKKLNWNLLHICIALLASILPAGPFLIERRLLRETERKAV